MTLKTRMEQNNRQREFIIGDNWLYYKVYSGEKTSEYILEDIILPLTEDLLNKDIIQKWFFIRYQDPDNHIRLRLFCKDKLNVGNVINAFQPLFTELINNGLVWSIQTDTYRRELERYGNETIEIFETLFFLESKIITKFLKINKGTDREKTRWLFGLKMLDKILESFNLDLNEKISLIEKMKTSFDGEFGMNRFLKKQIDDKFRLDKDIIISFVEDNTNSDFEELILFYVKNISPIILELLMLKKSNKIEVNFDNLIFSYLHMSMNRLFKSKNRKHEMVMYNFLHRYYRLVAGRNKNIFN
jgi:thiopeptide-type bacteriocin biosynthesis protein